MNRPISLEFYLSKYWPKTNLNLAAKKVFFAAWPTQMLVAPNTGRTFEQVTKKPFWEVRKID